MYVGKKLQTSVKGGETNGKEKNHFGITGVSNVVYFDFTHWFLLVSIVEQRRIAQRCPFILPYELITYDRGRFLR